MLYYLGRFIIYVKNSDEFNFRTKEKIIGNYTKFKFEIIREYAKLVDFFFKNYNYNVNLDCLVCFNKKIYNDIKIYDYKVDVVKNNIRVLKIHFILSSEENTLDIAYPTIIDKLSSWGGLWRIAFLIIILIGYLKNSNLICLRWYCCRKKEKENKKKKFDKILELEKKVEKLKKEFYKEESYKNMLNESLNEYDIVFNCKSLKNPFKIKKSKYYDEICKIKMPVVVVLGNFEKGKSFILSELSGKIFPSGFNVIKPSACGFKSNFGENDNFLDAFFIETAGFDSPVEYFEDENEEIVILTFSNNLLFFRIFFL